MKLTMKISAAAVGLLLLFSQTFSVWNLRETMQLRLGGILNSEMERLNTALQNFENEFRDSRGFLQSTRGERYWGRSRFQNHYSVNAVLYYDGEELSNTSNYTFDIDYLQENADDFPELRRYLQLGIWYDNRSVMIGQAGDQRLLILYGETDRMKFGILHYRDITEVYKESRQLFWHGVFAAAVLAVVLILTLSLIIRRILRPVRRLSEAAAKIAAGDYRVRVVDYGHDEIGDVAKSFDNMARRVEEHVQAMAETNERQRRLLGALAHELKTPMTGIQGYAELLQRVELPPGRQRTALAYIEQECRRLSRLSVKLLQLAELSGEAKLSESMETAGEAKKPEGVEMPGKAGLSGDAGTFELAEESGDERCFIIAEGSGKTKPERKALKVKMLFSRTKALMHRRLSEKDLRLELWVEEGAETVEGDEDLLLSLLLNLTDNAVKASPPGGVVRLDASKTGIFVSDEGPGIPGEELSKITEPFYMVDKSRSRQEGGAGLGLALCDQIARLHGWSLRIESEPGKGTRAGCIYEGK